MYLLNQSRQKTINEKLYQVNKTLKYSKFISSIGEIRLWQMFLNSFSLIRLMVLTNSKPNVTFSEGAEIKQ